MRVSRVEAKGVIGRDIPYLDFSSLVTQLVLSVELNERISIVVCQDGTPIGQARQVEADEQGVITIPVTPKCAQSEIVLEFYGRTQNAIGSLKYLTVM